MNREWLLLVAVATTVGCGGGSDGPPRQPVSGSVSLAGKPLATGLITFTPRDAPEPVVTALIEEGSYSLRRAEGPIGGAQRVSIWAREATGKQVADPDDPERIVEETREVVPPRYNLRSELSAEILQDGDNVFDFHLQAAPGS